MTSRRGVGHEWIKHEKKIRLFGAGGHHDGYITPLISGASARNKQVEEMIGHQGMGAEGSIDVVTHPVNNYNSNNEFNFSSYKRGPTKDGDFYVSFGQELSSGDIDANILNPRSSSIDETVKALGIESDRIWGAPDYGDEPLLGYENRNPFLMTRPVRETHTQEQMSESMAYYEGGGDGGVRDEVKQPDNVNAITGLRKMGIHKNSSMLKQRLQAKTSLVDVYNNVYESYAVAQAGDDEQMAKMNDLREEQYKQTRFDGSMYISSQAGLTKISKETQKKRPKEHSVNYFNVTPIGV